MKRVIVPALALLLTAGGLAGCAGDFWAMNPPTEIPLAPALAGDLFIGSVEVRSAFYSPPDAFSDIFIPAFVKGAACFSGRHPARAIVFIHELDRQGDFMGDDGKVVLPGSVDIHDARGRVIGRYPVRVELPDPGRRLTERRVAAAEAFGERLCEQAQGG